MLLREILKQSFKIVWQNPIFWIFGFFSTLFFLPANEFLLIFIFSSLLSIFPISKDFPLSKEVSSFKQPIQIIKPYFLALFLLIILFFLFLSVFSEIFLILSTAKKTKEKVEKIKIKDFLKILFVRLLGIIILGFFWIILAKLINNLPSLLFIFLVSIFSLFTLFSLFFLRYLVFYLIIRKSHFSLSLKKSFYFLKGNWFTSLKLSFFLFIIIFLYGFIAFILLQSKFFSYPLRIFNFIFTGIFGKYAFWTLALFTALFVVILQVIISGLINSYQIVSWAFFFLKKSGEIVNNLNKNKKDQF